MTIKKTLHGGKTDDERLGAVYRRRELEKSGKINIKPWEKLTTNQRRIWGKREF